MAHNFQTREEAMAWRDRLDAWRAQEYAGIGYLSRAEVEAKIAEWRSRLGSNDPDEAGFAHDAVRRYSDELQAIRVDELRAAGDTAGEFVLATGLRIIPESRWNEE